MALVVLATAPSFALIDENPGWEFRIKGAFSPLLVDARATVDGHSVSFVTNSSEFIGLQTSGVKVRLEAWKGHWGITADNTWAGFSAESRVDSATTVKLSGHDFSTELGGSYMFLQQRFSQDAGIMAEAMAGARIVALREQLEFNPGSTFSDNKSYVDPFVGGRVTWILGKMWSMDVIGNAGGFGIGSGSELTWMIQPELNLRISQSLIVNFGFRNYDVRTEDESGAKPTQFDGRVYGTFIGVEFRLK